MSENIKANVGSWDEDFPADSEEKQDDTKRLPFMKFDKPRDYMIRLVGNHVKFYRHWQPFTERVITHPEYKNEDPAWQNGFIPRETFAIHIIDREDGKLKIMEKGRSLFKQFARYKIVNEINPAGQEGPDWVITVEWPNGNKRQAKYTATAKQKAAPWTKEEVDMIKANKAPLKEIYATTPLDKIKELWENVPEESKVPSKESNEQKAPKKEKQATPPVIDDDLPDAPSSDDTDDLFDDDDTF